MGLGVALSIFRSTNKGCVQSDTRGQRLDIYWRLEAYIITLGGFFPIFFNGLSKSSVTVSDVRISLCGARPVADGGINLENRGTKNHIMLHFSSTFVGIYCFRMFSTSKNIASNSYINTKER